VQRQPTTIDGTGGPDRLVGSSLRIDSIFAFAGDDFLSGGMVEGDCLCGGSGNDLLKGGDEEAALEDTSGDGVDTCFIDAADIVQECEVSR
jgi:RTX calcium-binding nonapeptide repeat (4 copies)